MTFLKINGLAIPVITEGISETTQESAPASRAYSGKMRPRRRSLNRVWRVTTTPMSYGDAEAMRGWLTWRGQQFPYSSDLFSSRGLPAQSGSSGILMPSPDTGTSLLPVLTSAKYGTGSLVTGPTATNLLTSAQAIPNSTGIAAMTASGSATKAVSSVATMHQATNMLMTTPAAAGPGTVALSAVTSTAGSTYTFHAWLLAASGSPTVRLVLVASNGTTVNGPNVTLSTTSWQHVSISMTMPASTTTITPKIQENPANQSASFYVESMMLELGSGAQAWVAGGSARAAARVTYGVSNDMYQANAVTWMAWVGPPPMLSGGDYVAFMLSNLATSNRIEGHMSGAGVLSIASVVGGVTTTTVTASGKAIVSPFSHLAFVCRQNGGDEIWLDGVKLTVTDNTVLPTLNTLDTFEVGTTSSTLPWCAPIDEMILMPFAASQGIIQGVFNEGTSIGSTPTFLCEGLWCPDSPVSCTIHEVTVDRTALFISGTWQKAAASLSFTMAEV